MTKVKALVAPSEPPQQENRESLSEWSVRMFDGYERLGWRRACLKIYDLLDKNEINKWDILTLPYEKEL